MSACGSFAGSPIFSSHCPSAPNESRLLRTPTIGLEFLGQEMSVNLDALEQELERLDVVSQRGA
jgi:hypothetical protein